MMGKYVLAIKGNERVHVGETADFIQHIGRGVAGGDFEAQRLKELARRFELYDEDGFPLDVKRDGDDVKLVRRPGVGPVPGPPLVARINFLLAQAQAELDQAMSEAVGALGDAVGAANAGGQDLLNNQGDATVLAAETQNVADGFESVRGVLGVGPFPVVQADLAVVLAALTEDFGSAVHGGPPNRGSPRHNWLHQHGMTH
jgi:hypothetical protein